jgi:hypothetical protein
VQEGIADNELPRSTVRSSTVSKQLSVSNVCSN